jgi:signal transduction histidine kinase
MKRETSLARRIVVAFVMMTVVVAGLFSLTVLMAVSHTEENYSSYTMNKQLDDILNALERGLPFHLDQDMALYVVGADGQPPLPAWLGPLRPGFQEAYREDREFHVMVREIDGKRYVLLLDQEELDRREDMMQMIVFRRLPSQRIRRLGPRPAHGPPGHRPGDPALRAGAVQGTAVAGGAGRGLSGRRSGRLAAAFDDTLGRLRQALERERIFTSDVSHELRTPLMVIASSCDLLLAQGLADTRQQTQIGRIRSACAEMQELVETFMRLARTADDRVEEAEASLTQLASEQIDRLRPEAEVRGLELGLVREGGDSGLYPTPLLRAVLSNLLRNAIHYTDKGYVRLVLRPGGFSVCDSGAGIPPEKRESVFLPFVRGDATRGDGLGLGLSLVQRICQRKAGASG